LSDRNTGSVWPAWRNPARANAVHADLTTRIKLRLLVETDMEKDVGNAHILKTLARPNLSERDAYFFHRLCIFRDRKLNTIP
jgi:hypothetical protein